MFTDQIGDWWRPNTLFEFTRGRTGRLAFTSGPARRLVERYDDGTEFEIGVVRRWDAPRGLVVSWRQATFARDQDTELHVTFEPVGAAETRIVVEHFGWDRIPQEHPARHGFPLAAFQRRHGEWWASQLTRVAALNHEG